ncbi:hypothetical protein F0726_02257 [Acidithiobacillus caldus]|nr:hypothetical protein F0726_02257 [Acidithiobacillus caldus]
MGPFPPAPQIQHRKMLLDRKRPATIGMMPIS